MISSKGRSPNSNGTQRDSLPTRLPNLSSTRESPPLYESRAESPRCNRRCQVVSTTITKVRSPVWYQCSMGVTSRAESEKSSQHHQCRDQIARLLGGPGLGKLEDQGVLDDFRPAVTEFGGNQRWRNTVDQLTKVL